MGTGAYSWQKRYTHASFEMDDIQIEWYLVIKQTANTNVKPLGNSLEMYADAMCRCIAISTRLKLSKRKLFANRACKRPADQPTNRLTEQPANEYTSF